MPSVFVNNFVNAWKKTTKLCLPVLSALDVVVIPEVLDAAVSVDCVTVCKNTHGESQRKQYHYI